MADITISDLELAPALTDDMVLPVENTTDTYAATLAMLRRLINKTFVEVENADFNALTDDGFYQCAGTPTNSPVAGAINWTLQVSAESGVIVQRAFSLDDNFANLYIRRWNGVTWTGWLEVGEGALANKANISLSNIDATGQAKFDAKANIALTNSPYTTNRILEIPQDIKLELNNGTLTLKAGSKLYYPDGFESDGTTPKFFEYIVPNDYSFTGSDYGFTGIHILAFVRNQSGIYLHVEPEVAVCYSGTTAPTNLGQYAYWWDLSTNQFKWTRDSGSTWELFGTCLPVALFHYNGTDISGIDQIFNGFGYIGSTVFLLPGVKTVVPDGRNEDGTCKNKAPSTVASVKTETISSAYTAYMFTNQASSVISTHHYVCSKTKPTVTATTLWYNPETNLPSQVLSNGTVMTPYWEIPLAKFTSDSTGKITSFEPFTVDSVLNSSLSNLSAAGQAKFDAKADESQFQVVSALPANPDPNVFYFIPE